VDPLLRDVMIDRALDAPAYRARRILLSWTAFLIGMGRPAWILQVYALQNVASWLVLSYLLCRWFPPSNGRAFALWTVTLLSPGLLASVKNALPDGPSALLLTCAVALVETKRSYPSAVFVALAGLARETALLGAGLFASLLRRQPRTWLVALSCVLIAIIPFAVWLDYLRSLYRSLVFATGHNFSEPLAGFLWKLEVTGQEISRGVTQTSLANTTALVALCAQSACVVWACVDSSRRSAWALSAVPFVALALVLGQPVWDGSPGAYTRVLLPLTIGANAVLGGSGQSPWWVIGLTNLGVGSAVLSFL
jgi:hypothetical protein